MASHTAVCGLYKDPRGVAQAVTTFQKRGFRNTGISILAAYNHAPADLPTDIHPLPPVTPVPLKNPLSSLGGALGSLEGVGLFAVPGVGIFIAAGPVMTLLAAAGMHPIGGTVLGTLVRMGIPEPDASRYADRISDGNVLFSIHCDCPACIATARKLLKHTGAAHTLSAAEIAGNHAADKPFPCAFGKGA